MNINAARKAVVAALAAEAMLPAWANEFMQDDHPSRQAEHDRAKACALATLRALNNLRCAERNHNVH